MNPILNMPQPHQVRTIHFGMKQEQIFLEMGKSSSNVPNVFEGSPLTFRCGY